MPSKKPKASTPWFCFDSTTGYDSASLNLYGGNRGRLIVPVVLHIGRISKYLVFDDWSTGELLQGHLVACSFTGAALDCHSTVLVKQRDMKAAILSHANRLSKSLSTLITFAASISIAGLPSNFSGVATLCASNFGIQLAISPLARS
jgi:hypothetical protein